MLLPSEPCHLHTTALVVARRERKAHALVLCPNFTLCRQVQAVADMLRGADGVPLLSTACVNASSPPPQVWTCCVFSLHAAWCENAICVDTHATGVASTPSVHACDHSCPCMRACATMCSPIKFCATIGGPPMRPHVHAPLYPHTTSACGGNAAQVVCAATVWRASVCGRHAPCRLKARTARC
eukprot:365350-Chlamydomonas_euryale.AAC.6